MICLNSGVDVVGNVSSEMEDADDTGVRIFDNSDRRVSGLYLILFERKCTFSRIASGRGRRVLNQRHVAVYNDRPFYVPNIEKRNSWGAIPLYRFCLLGTMSWIVYLDWATKLFRLASSCNKYCLFMGFAKASRRDGSTVSLTGGCVSTRVGLDCC